jgi:hypothetical protein
MELSEISLNHEAVDWSKCLQHWSWLLKDNPEFSIWMVTKFAEILVVDNEEAVWFISTAGASFEKVAESIDDFSDSLSDPEVIDYYFMPSVILSLEAEGKKLKEAECFGFITPNVFQECTFDTNNFKVTKIESYLIGLGDMLGSLMDTPNGQRVKYHVVP